MQIQVNTDNFIQGDERLEEVVKKDEVAEAYLGGIVEEI